MHREIQIKQFPIVTTHWWPKTRNERFVWETNSIYIVFYLLYTTMSKWSECRTHPVCDVCVRALAHAAFTGRRRQRLTEGVSEAWCWRAVIVTTTNHILLWCCNERDWVFAWGDLIGWRLHWRLKSCVSTTLQTRPPSSVDADAPCECSVSQSVRTHTSHTGCVCALRSLGHGCVQEVKNDINTVRFLTQTSSFRVLGHQCVVTMGNCLIWISLCMFFSLL